jgi:hypothetical protein
MKYFFRGRNLKNVAENSLTKDGARSVAFARAPPTNLNARAAA